MRIYRDFLEGLSKEEREELSNQNQQARKEYVEYKTYLEMKNELENEVNRLKKELHSTKKELDKYKNTYRNFQKQISDYQIEEVKKLLNQNYSYREISSRVGISIKTISLIKNGKYKK